MASCASSRQGRPPPWHDSAIARLVTCFLAALAACLLTASGASAASFNFAIGSDPDLKVDSAGTAHVVWFDLSPAVNADTVNYCQIPRGATACTNTQTLATGSPGARPTVTLGAPGQVIVDLGTDSGANVNRVRQSLDNGITFGPPQIVADPQGPSATTGPGPDGDVVYGPGNSLSYVNGLSSVGTFVTNASLDGGAAEQDFVTLSTTNQSDATVGLFNGNPVVVADNFQDIVWFAYDGTGDVNSEANWTPQQVVEAGAETGSVDDVKLAGGTGGLFLMYKHGSPGATQYVVRQFTGTGFGPATPISESGDPIFGDMTQDAAGRLHAIWDDNTASPNVLRWATSTAGGAAWGQPLTLAADGEHVFPPTSVGAAPDGQGFAAWESGQGGPNGAASELRATPLEPDPNAPETCLPPTCLPAGGDTTKDLGDSLFGLDVTVPSCGSDEVIASLTVKKRKNKKKVKVKKVIFRLDNGKQVVDKKKPYTQTLRLANVTPGSLHTLTVKAKMKIKKKGKKPKKKVLQLSKDFFYCP
jgi:hypothetical protein